ncbi:sulfhydryl oxidase-1 [Coleophoma cylindrospora]|uniref:Sulfhydryl oxidase n=1 Tax=Coleophoma cylindrospora TaxID=1849047 RepID=A0A3D8R2F9_9HELO|nr:sulfhydryl oxidase-1 [Coleophoma cylindrospora]
MADDARDDGPAATSTTATTLPKTKLPKGMIMGKDGKPCRTCNSLADFTSQSKVLKSTPAITSASATAGVPADCPADVEALGRSSWTLLHSISATYPVAPTAQEQSDVKSFLGLFGKLYPCWVCAEDFQEYMEREKIKASSRDEFGRWLCGAHNEVNRKLGKKEFDCNLWEERWRTGWKDGRCG